MATALSAFFRNEGYKPRFENVKALIGGDSTSLSTSDGWWNAPKLASDFKGILQVQQRAGGLVAPNRPKTICTRKPVWRTGTWIDKIAGPESRLALVETEVCSDYSSMKKLEDECLKKREYNSLKRIKRPYEDHR